MLLIAGEGEPLFHWNMVKELIIHTHSLDMATILYTNGNLLDEKKSQFLFEHNATVIISLDSLNQSTYCQLVNNENVTVETVKNNIKNIRKIYKQDLEKKGNTTITRLGIITIAMTPNMNEIEKIKNFCRDDIFFISNYPIKKGNAEKNWEIIVGDKIDKLQQLAHQYTETEHGGLSTPLKDGKCIALYNGITIDTDGNVLVCPASVDSIIGNIKDSSMKELWIKTKENAKKQGSPLCIGRNIVLKEHDGIIMKQI